MEPDHVLFLFGYYYWATDIILDATDKLNFTCQLGEGPVRARFIWQTIMHVLTHSMHRPYGLAAATNSLCSSGKRPIC
jgi:hypothetical protein